MVKRSIFRRLAMALVGIAWLVAVVPQPAAATTTGDNTVASGNTFAEVGSGCC